jgi:hypothetical protein
MAAPCGRLRTTPGDDSQPPKRGDGGVGEHLAIGELSDGREVDAAARRVDVSG